MTSAPPAYRHSAKPRTPLVARASITAKQWKIKGTAPPLPVSNTPLRAPETPDTPVSPQSG
ncbi:MAG: hypothetical protein K2I25_02880, partial [Muribaculaceae bacterium]|nr:hypothetical protein [Muribaculaceae bacterium]